MARGQPKTAGSGRKRGTPNKATTERMVQAQQLIDAARTGEIELGKDVLNRMMKLAEGATALHRPTPPAEVAAGRAPAGDWTLFGAWFDRTVFCAKELAKYQSPTFKAIAVAAVPPQDVPRPQQIDDDGKVVRLNDPVALQRIYRNMVVGKR